jgi:hypothetical protein
LKAASILLKDASFCDITSSIPQERSPANAALHLITDEVYKEIAYRRKITYTTLVLTYMMGGSER